MTQKTHFAFGSVSGTFPMNGGSPAPLSDTIEMVMSEIFPDFLHLGVVGLPRAEVLGWLHPGTHARPFPYALQDRYDRMLLESIASVELSTMKTRHVMRMGAVKQPHLMLARSSMRAIGFYAHALTAAGLEEESLKMRRLLAYCGSLGVVILGESRDWSGVWHAVCGSQVPAP